MSEHSKLELEETEHIPPPILYQYCCVKKVKKILETTAFRLSSPRSFNDPFDTHFRISLNEEDLRRHLEQNAPSPNERAEIPKQAQQNPELHGGEIPSEIQDSFHEDSIKKLFGISCFSETKESILMWGHYAGSHRGVCLGFNGPGLQKNFSASISEMQQLQTIKMLRKVSYVDELPTFKLVSEEEDRANVFWKKSRIWSYEKEWRTISYLGENEDMDGKLQNFPKEILAEIIFGVNTKQEDIERIRTIANEGGYSPKFIKAKKSATKYEIEFVPCP